MRAAWKTGGKVVVFAAGRFDLLHPGHVRLLQQARELGDVLVVGVRGDNARLGELGEAVETVTPVAERAEILAAFAAVDYVVILSERPQEFVGKLKPEIVVEGGTPGQKALPDDNPEILQTAGTQLVRVPLEPGYSTAGLMERIRQIQA